MNVTMTANEIRSRFLVFFERRGHAILPSASLLPENDPSVLFNTAGMQPLVPYLLGEKHPKGTRLANSQKCIRTVDIDEIGDNTHATFFEMLGNWSLGDYFKEEAIRWSYEFLIDKKEGLGLDPI
jgi:alanyl-tRNA synthetase